MAPRRTAPKNIPWSDIEALLKKGWEPRDIALRFGCSVQNIYERMKRRRERIEREGAA
jgi:hypothetical protein